MSASQANGHGLGPRACLLKADGTNCEHETAHALRLVGARPEIVPMNQLRARERRLADYDLLVVPGGFSYGDDVGAGKVMAVELMSFLADEMAEFMAAGKPMLGICNGFQVLVRTGLLPFGDLGSGAATLGDNLSGRYECRWVRMAAESDTRAAFLHELPAQMEMPMAHGEGRFWADEATLARIEAEGLVALRYVDTSGKPTHDYPANPNGALHAIAGVCDPSGRVLGLMPHPERFIEDFHHPAWRSRPSGRTPDGLAFLRAFVATA
jgi:phosphoribosylformylglycinamidine synthase